MNKLDTILDSFLSNKSGKEYIDAITLVHTIMHFNETPNIPVASNPALRVEEGALSFGATDYSKYLSNVQITTKITF